MTTTVTGPMRVRVSGWDHARQVIVEDDRILMEVARTSNNCHHCPTCRRRVDTVEQALARTAIVWKWEFPKQGGMWLALPRTDDTDPVELLRRATGLPIYC